MKKETKTLDQVKVSSQTGGKARRVAPSYSAQEKAEAVLAVWTERARAADICRQLSISPISFYQWQERAMEGMLQALESRVNLASGEALSPRLQTLLARRQRAQGASSRLGTRLEKIQKSSSLESNKAAQV